MTDRFSPIAPWKLTREQHKVHDKVAECAEELFGNKFLYKNKDGAFIGPFAPLLYTPNVADPFFNLIIELSKMPDFPAAAKETAILATGSHFKAGYEMYAHGKVAELTSLTHSQIESIKQGIKPTGPDALDEQTEIAFDVAIELAKGGGPLSQASWNRAVKSFGKSGAAALIHYVGAYAYTCILLNGVDAAVPVES